MCGLVIFSITLDQIRNFLLRSHIKNNLPYVNFILTFSQYQSRFTDVLEFGTLACNKRQILMGRSFDLVHDMTAFVALERSERECRVALALKVALGVCFALK